MITERAVGSPPSFLNNMFDKLNDSNFIMYAMKHYDNPQCCSIDEFNEDINRFKYIKKLITRYVETGDLKERLILNHLIVLNNVFGAGPLVRMIFLKLDKHLMYIKPFLILLSILPTRVYGIRNEKVIETDAIPMDPTIIEVLRNL
jgi:hypothetical protein